MAKGVVDTVVVPRRQKRSEKEFDFQSWQKPSPRHGLMAQVMDLPDESFYFFSCCGYADPRRESIIAQPHLARTYLTNIGPVRLVK